MKNNSILKSINYPSDIKKLSLTSLEKLSKEISLYIQEVVQENGGHYSSPLGVVDLTIAMHYVYNSPYDKLIWDVGHQAYAHKIITGRKEDFKKIRKKNSISGFLKRDESQHDIFGAGHASTSISAALGVAHARDRNNDEHNVVAIIGDGAMTGGLAYEGLNNLGYHRTQLTVVLNDNSHSISKSVGALSHYLTKISTNPTYNKIRNDIWEISGKIPLSSTIRKILKKTEEGIKGYLTPGVLFEELGLRYIGPINGHDIKELINAFNAVKKMKTPVLLHIYTSKGKGSLMAETDAVKYYSMKGKNSNKKDVISYSSVLGNTLKNIAKNDDKLICVTAAMEIGTGIKPFAEEYPERYVDVGIAEEHAITYAAGLSSAGFIPVVPIYSTFMQRAYDNIFHDALLQNLPIIYCMDRAGLVGEDGPTHHGVFDIAFMRSFPEMIVSAPKDGNELKDLLYTAIQSKKNFSIRYPKGDSYNYQLEKKENIIDIGTWEILKKGENVVILAVGSMVNMIISNYDLICNELKYKPTVINARFIKPFDCELLKDIINEYNDIITIEEGILTGGFGSGIGDYLHQNNYKNNLYKLGIPDNYIHQGTRSELLNDVNLNYQSIIKILKKNEF